MTFFNIDTLDELKKLYGYLPITPLTDEEAAKMLATQENIRVDFSNIKDNAGTALASGCQGGTSCSL